jgi:hypothetical protein
LFPDRRFRAEPPDTTAQLSSYLEEQENHVMTDTEFEIPDYVTMVTPGPKRSTAELATFVVGLLMETLPEPEYVTISQAGQEACLQFDDSPDSFAALAKWAERFGGTVTGCPHNHSSGRQSVHCTVKFTHDGVKVEAYAFITVPTADPATT